MSEKKSNYRANSVDIKDDKKSNVFTIVAILLASIICLSAFGVVVKITKSSKSNANYATKEYVETLINEQGFATEDYVENAVLNGADSPTYYSKDYKVIDEGLTYQSGYTAIEQIGEILWIVDSGVYKMTDEFEAKNMRPVLEFTLPKNISLKLYNSNGANDATGTICYVAALYYEHVTYTTNNCQAYLTRTVIGEDADTFRVVYTGLADLTSEGGLTGFHLRIPLLLV